ncbi:acyltransferase [Marinobacter fuscus]|uniref:Acyltransferase n=1 Tax=Marinobacter fuscus TaxID=2109942 RepID=A0A2T1K348_9GAMM|nr:acyltransferase family protein [Marinobacter fuscus]PSF04604.1 acyltransferase [Marinobacter fuscus]
MNKSYPYVPAIDGIRAIAVLAVMVYHLNAAWLPGGFAGVDVFFVISGYVVARSLAGRGEEPFGRFLLGFYSRRIRRIVPALLVCLLATTVLTILFIPDSWLSSTTSQVGLYAFFGLSNFALVWFQDDYFSPRAEFNPFVHTWSLGVEEQFYFLFPLLIFLWFRVSGKRAPFRTTVNALIPVLAGASLYTAYYLGKHQPDWAYYLLPARFWELAAGVLLFQLQMRRKLPVLNGAAAPRMLLAGLLLIAAGYAWSDVEAFPYPWAILPVAGTVLALWGVSENLNTRGWFVVSLTAKPVVYIGKMSYSLYLWHWPVYTLMRWTVGLESPAQMAIAVSTTFVLASVSYYLIETPARQARYFAQPAYRAVVAGLLCVGLFWTTAENLFERRSDLTLSVTRDTETWYPYAYREADAENQRYTLDGRQLFVIGNSHTGAYATMLNMLQQRHGIQTHLLQTGHCALGNLLYPIGDLEGCESTIDDYLSLLEAQAKPGDMVFLASLRTHRLADQWERNPPEEVLAYSQSQKALNHISAAYAETSTLIRRLEQLGLIVLIDLPKPVMKAPVYRCADWFNRHNPICADIPGIERSFLNELRAPVVHSLQRLASENAHVHLWDPAPQLCNAHRCPAYDTGGKPLFFDGDHLSAHGNRVLYPAFEQRVLAIYRDCLACKPEVPVYNSPIVPGVPIDFSKHGNGQLYLTGGWSHAEDWGTWSSGRKATITLPIRPGTARSLRISGHGFVNAQHPQQRVHVQLNGIDTGTIVFDPTHSSDIDIPIPRATREAQSNLQTLSVVFLLPDAVSPAELGMGGDPRRLGFGIRSLSVQ